MLPSTTSAPSSRTCSGYMALTVAAVPTGMKAGVRMVPRGIVMAPVRAWPSRACTAKRNSGLVVSGSVIGSCLARFRPKRMSRR